MTEAEAYIAGWRACFAGVDGRYAPLELYGDTKYAWKHGWLDALEAEENEEPQPACVGYD